MAARFSSKAEITSPCSIVRPISSRPLIRQCFTNGSISNLRVHDPSAVLTVWRRDRPRLRRRQLFRTRNQVLAVFGREHHGEQPILAQLLRKISANDGAIIAFSPRSSSARARARAKIHSRIRARNHQRRALEGGVVQDKVRVLLQSSKANGQKPVRSIRFRNSLE